MSKPIIFDCPRCGNKVYIFPTEKEEADPGIIHAYIETCRHCGTELLWNDYTQMASYDGEEEEFFKLTAKDILEACDMFFNFEMGG